MRTRITMVAPRRERCGVSQATRGLVAALARYVEVTFDIPPEEFAPAANDVDLVHVQHQYFLYGGVAPWRATFHRLARQIRRPAVLTAHEVVLPSGNPLRALAIRWSNRLHFRHACVRRVLVHTDQDAERIAAAGVRRELVRVVRLGVPELPDLPDRAAARRLLGLENRAVVLLPGFVSRRKGHARAIAAAQALPGNYLLVIAGGRHPDDRSDYVRGIERSADHTGNVRITGYLSDGDLALHLAAADLAIAPFAESSGSASLGLAFAAGLPVVASDIPPHREIAGVAPDALQIATSAEPEALADAIRCVLEDDARRARLAAGSHAYAATFSFDRQARDTVAVYREVMGLRE